MGHSLESAQHGFQYKEVNFHGQVGKLRLCDNPGIADGYGKDSENLKNLIIKCHKLKFAHAVLFVMNGSEPRFDIF